jgi:hypothetical protein
LFGIYAYEHFDTSVFRLCLLLNDFSFILLHLSFDCIVSEIFFFYYGASVFRLQLRIDFLWLLSMEKELVLQIFYYYIQNVWVKNFLIARRGFILAIFMDLSVFCSSN